MRAAVFYETRDLRVSEIDMPRLIEGHVLLQVEYCGICGTDNLIYNGQCYANTPLILGHEYSGIIIETGKNVNKYKPGMRVVVDPNIFCGKCSYCRKGKVHLCDSLISLGVIKNGGFATHSIVPESNIYECNNDINLDIWAMVEPLACCIHGIGKTGISAGDVVLIFGAGLIGNMMIQLARISGASIIIVSDPLEKRRQYAKQSGADFIIDPLTSDIKDAIQDISAGGADIIIDCSGSGEAQANSLDLVKKGGVILFFGCSPEERRIDLSPFKIFRNEVSIIGSINNPFCHERAIRLIASKTVALGHLITHRFELNKIKEAFNIFGNADTLKIMITPNS